MPSYLGKQNTENANCCAGQPQGRPSCLLSRAPELWNLSAQTTMTQPQSWTTLLFASLQRQNLAFQDVKRKRREEWFHSPQKYSSNCTQARKKLKASLHATRSPHPVSLGGATGSALCVDPNGPGALHRPETRPGRSTCAPSSARSQVQGGGADGSRGTALIPRLDPCHFTRARKHEPPGGQDQRSPLDTVPPGPSLPSD